MMWLSRVGGPFVALLTGTTNLILRIFGIKGQAEQHLTEEEIKAVIWQGAESGVLEAEEESIVQRVLQLGDQRVSAIMTPRPDIEWIDADASAEELRAFLASHNHTQFVVCQSGLDNVLGIVRSADLLPMAMRGDAIELRTVTQDALFVPDSMPAVQLLDSFRSSHKHMALVMDEFGAVEGVVTVTDMLEALVGHLPASASDAASVFVARADGSWLVEGSASMEEVMTRFALDPLPAEEAGAYHTLGGFVMARLGRVPTAADHFEWGGMRFEVMDMDGRRIDKVLINGNREPGAGNRAPPGTPDSCRVKRPRQVALDAIASFHAHAVHPAGGRRPFIAGAPGGSDDAVGLLSYRQYETGTLFLRRGGRRAVGLVRYAGRAADPLNYGGYAFDVRDATTNELRYSHGFGSIYGEWVTTEEAKTKKKKKKKKKKRPDARHPSQQSRRQHLRRVRLGALRALVRQQGLSPVCLLRAL